MAKKQRQSSRGYISPLWGTSMYLTPANKESASWRRRRQRLGKIKKVPEEAGTSSPPSTPSIEEYLAYTRQQRSKNAGDPGTQTTFTGGFIYIASNPAWSGCLKIGMAVDYETRLDTFQTYSPYRDYALRYVVPVSDRDVAEQRVKDALASYRINHDREDDEWFNIGLQAAIEIIFAVTKPMRLIMGS